MRLLFCTECAAPLVKDNDTKYTCTNGHPYYNNPRAACSIIFVNDKGELLYSKRAHEPAAGKYDFPGGFLDYGEDAYRASQREITEELGAQIDAADLELLDTGANHYSENVTTCDVVFLCRKWQGAFQPADDVAACEWKPLDFLLSDDFAWPYAFLYDKLKKVLHQ